MTFVDVVYRGSTFTELFDLLRAWIDYEREPWPIIRRKVRFVGVTSRTKTSPNTYRWQQQATWTRQLPARAVVNVSLHPGSGRILAITSRPAVGECVWQGDQMQEHIRNAASRIPREVAGSSRPAEVVPAIVKPLES